jgi:hypothetical protein
MERQLGSVRGTRWTAGLGAGHMVVTRARRSHGQSSRCTVVVESSGLMGGRTKHTEFGGLPTKPSENGFLVWASKPSPRAQHDGDGIRACRVLTPKFGKESDLWVQLGEKPVRRKEGFFRCIRQKNPRSAICFRSARKLLSLFCRIIW